MKLHPALASLLVALAPLASCGGAQAPPPVPESAPAGNAFGSAANATATPPQPKQEARLAYPASRKVDAADTYFGVAARDPYRWLEDGASEEVKAWAQAEDTLARTVLAKLPERDALVSRLTELLYVDRAGVPRRRGGRLFYAKRGARQEKWVVYAKDERTGAERALLDPNAWSKDGSVALGGWWPSHDGKLVAYTVKKNNSDEATLHVLDAATGKASDVDVIEGAKYASAAWTARGDGFYYVKVPVGAAIPVAERPGYAEVRYHALGKDPAKDAIIRPKTGDPRTFLGVELSKDGRWLVLDVQHGWNSDDVYFMDLRKKTPAWQTLVKDTDARYEVTPHAGRFYAKTNDGAPRYRVVSIDPLHPQRDAWTEVVPERKDATLHDVSIVGGRLSLAWMKDVVTELETRALDGTGAQPIALPAPNGTASVLEGEPDDDVAYYSFASFTTPDMVLRYDVKSASSTEFFRTKVPVDTSKYVSREVFFTSQDGTRVPMFLVHAKDAPKDGSAPTLLTGYGGFQIARLPYFPSDVFAWLEKGGIFAFANLRGGSEYGEEWHRAGMGQKKQNVFDDFASAAQYLVREHYTRPEKLVISGRSNGGLLVGAAMTQHPDLFRAVLCGVPLLDMVRYTKFGSGKTWISEYGSADESEADFKALYDYSPYHHVKRGVRYPALLLLSADSDDRVDPMHARKFAAAMQEASTGGPVLLRVERNSGHGGADMVHASVLRLADEYAFALSEVSQ